MTTTQTTTRRPAERRGSVAVLIALGLALLAALFVAPSTAEARELRAAPNDGVAELTPDEWDCVLNYETEHVDFCIRLKEKPKKDSATTAVFVAPSMQGPGKDGPNTLCPAGTVATPFEHPIYDDDDLFVIGHETVWYCLPVDMEPAG